MTPHERLERSTWDLFWLPDGVTVLDRPELLALRTPRPLRYLNAVYRTRADAARLPELVREVDAFHQGVDSRWAVVDTVDTSALEAQLSAHGYTPGHAHHARVIAVDRFTPRPGSAVIVRQVTDERGLRDCWRVSEAAFEQDGNYTDADVPAELAECTGAGARVQRFVAYLGEVPVSSGGINLYPELGIGFLWAGGTVPAARGRGAYSALVAARAACAAARGIELIGLYARVESSSPIVGAQGFANVGRMSYWERPAAHRSAH